MVGMHMNLSVRHGRSRAAVGRTPEAGVMRLRGAHCQVLASTGLGLEKAKVVAEKESLVR